VEQFGTLTERSVHPASPVLLTKNGPLKTYPIRSQASADVLLFVAKQAFGFVVLLWHLTYLESLRIGSSWLAARRPL